MKELFWDFVVRRHITAYNYYVRKLQNPWPTDDPILSKYHYCNVMRELDKGTKYLIDLVKRSESKYGKMSNHELFWTILAYRHFNRVGLFEDLASLAKELFNRNSQDTKIYESFLKYRWPIITNENERLMLEKFFDKAIESGIRLYHAAYIVYLIPNKNYPRKEKHVQFTFIQPSEELADNIINAKTPEEAFNLIRSLPYIGNFLAYEIWTDLAWPTLNRFNKKFTDNDFVNIGPGAAWGLSLIYGGVPDNYYLRHDLIDELYKEQFNVLDKITRKYDYRWTYICDQLGVRNYLSKRNIEHSLCEFRKYWNRKNGKGRKRYFKVK